MDYSCLEPKSVVHAAVLFHDRLKAVFYGGYGVPNIGFVFTSPSDFLGLYGLAEGILYVHRLYGLIMDHFGNETMIDHHRERFHRALNAIGRGYDEDFLMRHLLFMMDDLYQSEHEVYSLYDYADTLLDLDRICTTEFEPSLQAIAQSDITPRDKIVHSSGLTGKTISLNNGVHMPLVGLGTWQLEGEVCTETVYRAILKGYRHIDTAEAYR